MNARELFPILDANDVERLTRFYEEGLGATRSYRWPPEEVGPPEYVYLTLPPLGLGISVRPPTTTAQPTGVLLWVYVDDADAAVERLVELGAELREAPADMPWGERVGSVVDPDGHVLMLGQPAG